MQSVVCQNEVKWGENSRRILIFSTNSGFHNAGEGALKSHSGKCFNRYFAEYNSRYNSRHNYGYNTNYDISEASHDSMFPDYPFISHINYKVTEHKINVIFAVTSSQMSVYENLSYQVYGSSCTILAEDASNVADLIRNEYHVSILYIV